VAATGLAMVGATAGATLGAASPAGAQTATVVTVAHNPTWGQILTLGNGVTLYRLTADSKNKSTCTGACLAAWPPALLAAGQKKPVGHHGVRGLGTITTGAGRQVTYHGIPLYEFVGDHGPGQVNGNVADTWGQWWVVNPAHPLATPVANAPSTLHSGSSPSSPPTTAHTTTGGVSY
jgi:predicted lipoprotein with Yx(FWY)xxD motif